MIAYTLAEAVRSAVHAGAAQLHVALPAIIQAYHPAEQTVDVQPSLKLARELEDDTIAAEAVPTIYRVPVQFPGGGGYVLTFPVAVGDACLLVFTDRSLDNWMGQSGQVVDPVDLRLHDLSDAVALLGVRTASGALSPAPPTDRVVLGIPGGFRLEVGPGALLDLGGGSTDFVALASKVLAELNKVATAFNGHVHAAGTLVAGATPVTGATLGVSTSYSVGAVASAKAKVAT